MACFDLNMPSESSKRKGLANVSRLKPQKLAATVRGVVRLTAASNPLNHKPL